MEPGLFIKWRQKPKYKNKIFWRYGSAGKIFADNTNFSGNKNLISSENNSEILIKNSNFKGVLKITGDVLIE